MRTLLVDDHSLVLGFLREICEGHGRHEIVGEAQSGGEAVHLALATRPDLLLLDLHLPDINGFRVLQAIRSAGFYPKRVLFLSGMCTDVTVFFVERANVQGFLDKMNASIAILMAALQSIAAGETYWSMVFKDAQIDLHGNPNAFYKILSDREMEVLSLFGALSSDEEIASRLDISQETARKHRFHILRKLGMQTKFELMRYVRKHGFDAGEFPA